MNAHSFARGVRPRIIIDSVLYPRLLALAEQARKQSPDLAEQLLEEIERADLRAPGDMPKDVVTVGSEVEYRDGDRTHVVQVVMPRDADLATGKLSLLTPVGAALLGLTAGQRIEWTLQNGQTKVLEVLAVRQG
jgi:regulator of nucleoside diphosphate kinase